MFASNSLELESTPLDHSGTFAHKKGKFMHSEFYTCLFKECTIMIFDKSKIKAYHTSSA